MFALTLSITASLATVAPRAALADAGSRSDAIEQALARNGGGKVLGVREEQGNDGRITYSVKVLADGRVRVIRIKGE